MTTDQTPDSDHRYTITEAAQRLGISREALRLRIRRGRVLATKSGGQWYVHLPPDTGADGRADSDPDTTADTDQGERVAELREELGHARAEINRLWSALAVRDRELERKDAIILALSQRPALPAPQGLGERAGEGATMPVEAAETGEKPPVPSRPWWKWWAR
jgi:excisionase family DNA binding protein